MCNAFYYFYYLKSEVIYIASSIFALMALGSLGSAGHEVRIEIIGH